MEAASNAEPKRSYSWWWDSHISPKNSKWLQDNLTDMDNKIKAMIKLIEEDADSFARRAEMYYKKRPDLMKLVEEFYRAYRALAERYDHVTGALRQAHRTIAAAFPNQVQLTLPDEPPSGFLDENSYESELFDEILPFISKEGLKSLNWLFIDEDAQKKLSEILLKKSLNVKGNEGKHLECKKLEEEVSELSKENQNLKNEITLESLRADKAEAELQCLKDAVSKLKTELESAFLQYQTSEKRISSLETEISLSEAKCLHLNDEMSIKVSKLSIAEGRCIVLERENTSLQLELDKLNLVASKHQEKASDLLKENQNLHNRVDSESNRADRAEADSIRSRDAIVRLKSEMESALLQYHFSQGRISDLEAEISHTKEQFKNIDLEMSIRASKLNMAENRCLLLQDENKSLQRELDMYMKKVTSQEAEIIMREEELDKLEQSIEFERQRNFQAEMTENSLRIQLNKLEQKVERQEQDILIREQELDKLKQHVEDGWEQHLQSEIAHQALVELHSQSQEKSRRLDLENQNLAEKLRNTELLNSGLEEELKRLHDENNCLNEENFSSVSKMICLQDEILSLEAFKHKTEGELRFNAEEKMFLQQELSSYKSNRNDLEVDRHELIEKLQRMELREATFEEEMRCLHDENIGLYEKFFSFSSKIVNLQDDIFYLKESNYRLEDQLQLQLEEKKVLQHDLFSLKNERNVLEVRHQELTENVEELNCNVTSLQTVVKELRDENRELRDRCKKHEDEKARFLEQLKLINRLEDKNAFLDNSLSGANAELKNLLDKIKSLKEYSESLYNNVHSRISSEPVMDSHFEAVTHNAAMLENSISDLNVEFDVLRGKVKALEEPCQSLYHQKSHLITENSSNLVSQVERVGLHLQSLENRFMILEEKQLSTLSNQIHLLKKENQITMEELEEERLQTAKSEIDSFIVKQFLVESNEKNVFLSTECRKYMEKFELAENFIFELKQEWTSQEMKLITMSDRNEKLLERIHAMMMKCDAKKACEDCEISNDGYDDISQNILHKIVELHGSLAAAKGDIHDFQRDKPSSFTLLEQLAIIMAELRTQKEVLEQESLLRDQEIFILNKENHELLEMNEQLWTDTNAGKQREEMLTAEMERMSVMLSDLQEACQVSQNEMSKLEEENELLLKKLYELSDQSDALRDENDAILEKSIIQEQCSDIGWLIRDVNHLYRITNDLGQEIRVINRSTRAQEVEDRVHQARNALRKLGIGTETRKKLVEQCGMELSDTRGTLKSAMVKEEGLENIFWPLSEEENFCKDYEIGCLQRSNNMAELELQKLHKAVETLEAKEKNLTSELQKSTDECRSYKDEATELLHDLNVSSFMELIVKEKFFELIQILKGLETVEIVQLKIPVEETAIPNVQGEDLKEKIDLLRRENKELKEELSDFAPLGASLEEHALPLTNLHILNKKKKQGNILASLQRKKSSQVRSKHQTPRESAGISELKKLHAKVKVLQKEATDTVEQGKVDIKKSKAFKSTGTPKKKNIILDLRKSVNTRKNIEQLKQGIFSRVKHDQMMKDIELDHVLTGSQHEPEFNNVETDDHTLVVWEIEKSENPSSELGMEKELSINNLVLPANYNESLQEWIDKVSSCLSAGSQRLSALENSLEELKMDIITSEMKCQSSSSELNTVKLQMKEVEEAVMKLTDFNCKLAEVTKKFSTSSDSSKLRRKVVERVQRGAGKIDGLELKLQKVCSILLKLQKPPPPPPPVESKATKPLERRLKLPLKDLIYGKRSDPKQMKRQFCACIRFKTKEK